MPGLFVTVSLIVTAVVPASTDEVFVLSDDELLHPIQVQLKTANIIIISFIAMFFSFSMYNNCRLLL
jgi:hypothetical protein